MKFFLEILTFIISLFILTNVSATEIKEYNVCSVPNFYNFLNDINILYKQENNRNFSLYFDTSSNLYALIMNKGIKCDIYFGSDLSFHKKYIKSGLSNESYVSVFASTPLVLLSHNESISDCMGIDLEHEKIAIPNPSLYASGFEASKIIQHIKDNNFKNNRNRFNRRYKLLNNNTVYGDNEYQVLSFYLNNNVNYSIIPYNIYFYNKQLTNDTTCYYDNIAEDLLFYTLRFSNKSNDILEYIYSVSEEIYKNNGLKKLNNKYN